MFYHDYSQMSPKSKKTPPISISNTFSMQSYMLKPLEHVPVRCVPISHFNPCSAYNYQCEFSLPYICWLEAPHRIRRHLIDTTR